MELTTLTFKRENGELITLAPNEARALYGQLHELFGGKHSVAPLPPAQPRTSPHTWSPPSIAYSTALDSDRNATTAAD